MKYLKLYNKVIDFCLGEDDVSINRIIYIKPEKIISINKKDEELCVKKNGNTYEPVIEEINLNDYSNFVVSYPFKVIKATYTRTVTSNEDLTKAFGTFCFPFDTYSSMFTQYDYQVCSVNSVAEKTTSVGVRPFDIIPANTPFIIRNTNPAAEKILNLNLIFNNINVVKSYKYVKNIDGWSLYLIGIYITGMLIPPYLKAVQNGAIKIITEASKATTSPFHAVIFYGDDDFSNHITEYIPNE